MVDTEAARAELFAAAEACAGHWTLRGVLCGAPVTDPGLLDAYERLGRAEAVMAALVR